MMAQTKPTPGKYYVLSDAGGFVGAFLGAEEMKKAAAPYLQMGAAMVFQEFPRDSDQNVVYVVPYRRIDAVAFVSGRREQAQAVQEALCHVDLAYDDDVAYWEQKVGEICPSALRRLPRTAGPMTDEEKEQAHEALNRLLGRGAEEPPLEPKRLDLGAAFVPRPLSPPPAAGEPPGSDT